MPRSCCQITRAFATVSNRGSGMQCHASFDTQPVEARTGDQKLNPTRIRVIPMTTVYFEENLEGAKLKITDKYILYNGDIIPSSAVSYISVNRKRIHWFVPVVMIVLSLVLFATKRTTTMLFSIIAATLLIIGIVLLILAILNSRKRFITFYSHSRHNISILTNVKNAEYQPLVNAIFRLLEDGNIELPTSHSESNLSVQRNHSDYMPH